MRLQILWSDNCAEFDSSFAEFELKERNMERLYSADFQATISSSYMWLQILWSDNFAEFDQIPHLQNLD